VWLSQIVYRPVSIHRFHDKWKGMKIIVLWYVTPCTFVDMILTAKVQVYLRNIAWALYFWDSGSNFFKEKKLVWQVSRDFLQFPITYAGKCLKMGQDLFYHIPPIYYLLWCDEWTPYIICSNWQSRWSSYQLFRTHCHGNLKSDKLHA
jgi:hypothetical protein